MITDRCWPPNVPDMNPSELRKIGSFYRITRESSDTSGEWRSERVQTRMQIMRWRHRSQHRLDGEIKPRGKPHRTLTAGSSVRLGQFKIHPDYLNSAVIQVHSYENNGALSVYF